MPPEPSEFLPGQSNVCRVGLLFRWHGIPRTGLLSDDADRNGMTRIVLKFPYHRIGCTDFQPSISASWKRNIPAEYFALGKRFPYVGPIVAGL